MSNEVAPRRESKKYFADGFYSMHSDVGLEEFGLSPNLRPDFRIFLLATARSNRWGHCPFGKGELISLLDVSLNTMKKGLGSLVDAGMASPDSTPLCITLSARVVRRDDRASRRCIEPAHFNLQERMWVHGMGWEPEAGLWQSELNDPDVRREHAARFKATRTTTTTVTETIEYDIPA
jgi:hypothetical protein